MSSSRSRFICSSLSLLFVILNSAAAAPLGSSFYYQGKLTDAGSPANGPYDLTFKLYNNANEGSQIGTTLELPSVAVNEGIFSVELNYGNNAFNGQPCWLEIGVRPGGSTDPYATLNPRSEVLAAPHS